MNKAHIKSFHPSESQTNGGEWSRHSQLAWFGQCRWGQDE